MQIHRSAADIVVQTPAKLNLFFEVLARHDDGYHEIETLMCPIDLYDTLYFKEDPSGQIGLQCERDSGPGDPSGSGLGELPEGGDNLAVRACELLREQTGARCGASLRLVKRIPTAAGLGGGSSDAAAAMVVANQGWRLGQSLDDLARIAAKLGSDVPFFLVGGPAICRGRGERVEPVAGLAALHFVVVRPPAGLSTAAVYGACRVPAKPRPLKPLLDALKRGDINRAGRLLFNRLQPAAESLSPWIARLRREFDGLDCPGHGMSGSGTSYFGLCRHAKHARRIAGRLQANGARRVFAVQSCR